MRTETSAPRVSQSGNSHRSIDRVHLQRACRRIECGERTKWQRPLIVDMTEWNPEQRRDSECISALTHHRRQRSGTVVGVFVALRTVSKREADTPIKRAGQAKLRQHAVHAIRGFVDVFQHHNRAPEIYRPRRAAQ